MHFKRCSRPKNDLVAQRSNSFSFHAGRKARLDGAAVNGGDGDNYGDGMDALRNTTDRDCPLGDGEARGRQSSTDVHILKAV